MLLLCHRLSSGRRCLLSQSWLRAQLCDMLRLRISRQRISKVQRMGPWVDPLHAALKRMRPSGSWFTTAALAAMAVAASAAARLERHAATERSEPHRVDNWHELLQSATAVAGSPSAKTKIVALIDLQCPACRAFHNVADSLATARPKEIQLLYIAYPLAYHPSALPAARVGVCAIEERSASYARWINAVFEHQASLGKESWESFGEAAHLSAPAHAGRCASDSTLDNRLSEGQRPASKLNIAAYLPSLSMDGLSLMRQLAEH